MPAAMPRLHVNCSVKISIKTKDWNPSALPMVGFCLQVGRDAFVGGQCAVNSDGQTATVTLKIPQANHQGNGPYPTALFIAYCSGCNEKGQFAPNTVTPQVAMATGEAVI